MRAKTITRLAVAVLGFTLVAGVEGYAKNGRDMTLFYDATLGSAHLARGRYRVQWDTHSPETTVRFRQGKSVVATAEGKVVDRGKKYMSNTIVTTQNSDGSLLIQEIRFSGSSEVIVFNN